MALNAVLTSVQGACPEALSFEAWTLEVLSIDPMDPLDCEVNDLQAGNFKKVVISTAFDNGQALWIIVELLLRKAQIIRKVFVGLETLNGNLLAPLLMCWTPPWFDSERKSIKILTWDFGLVFPLYSHRIYITFSFVFFEAFCSRKTCNIHFSGRFNYVSF